MFINDFRKLLILCHNWLQPEFSFVLINDLNRFLIFHQWIHLVYGGLIDGFLFLINLPYLFAVYSYYQYVAISLWFLSVNLDGVHHFRLLMDFNCFTAKQRACLHVGHSHFHLVLYFVCPLCSYFYLLKIYLLRIYLTKIN